LGVITMVRLGKHALTTLAPIPTAVNTSSSFTAVPAWNSSAFG